MAITACGGGASRPDSSRVIPRPAAPAATPRQAYSEFRARSCSLGLRLPTDLSPRRSVPIRAYVAEPRPDASSVWPGEPWLAIPEFEASARAELRAREGIDSSAALGPEILDFWGARRVGADLLPPSTRDASSAPRLGVLDIGFSPGHSRLAGRVHDAWLVEDDGAQHEFHGTHVTGTVAARAPFGVGGNGNFGMVLSSYREPLNQRTSTFPQTVITRMSEMADRMPEVRALSASLRFGDDASYAAGVERVLREKRLLLVNAAGNDKQNLDATYVRLVDRERAPILFVSSVSPYGTLSWFSNFGTPIFVSAPGEQIFSLDRGIPARPPMVQAEFRGDDGSTSTITTLSGTSMATPHVSATVMRVLEEAPALSREAVMRVIARTAIDQGAPGRDSFYGHGMVNAYGAYELARRLGMGQDEEAALTEMRALAAAKLHEARAVATQLIRTERFSELADALARSHRLLRESFFLDPSRLETRRALALFESRFGSRVEAMALAFDVFTLTGERALWDRVYDGSERAARLFTDGQRVLEGEAHLRFARATRFDEKMAITAACARERGVLCGEAPVRTERELLKLSKAFRNAESDEERAAWLQWLVSDFQNHTPEALSALRSASHPAASIEPELRAILAQAPSREAIEFVIRASWRLSPTPVFTVEDLRAYVTHPSLELRHLALAAAGNFVPRDEAYFDWLAGSTMLSDALTGMLCPAAPTTEARSVLANLLLPVPRADRLDRIRPLLLGYWESRTDGEREALVGEDVVLSELLRQWGAPGLREAVRAWAGKQAQRSAVLSAAVRRFPGLIDVPSPEAVLAFVDAGAREMGLRDPALREALETAALYVGVAKIPSESLLERMRAVFDREIALRHGGGAPVDEVTLPAIARAMRTRLGRVVEVGFLAAIAEDLERLRDRPLHVRNEWAKAGMAWFDSFSYDALTVGGESAQGDRLFAAWRHALARLDQLTVDEWELIRKLWGPILPWAFSHPEREARVRAAVLAAPRASIPSVAPTLKSWLWALGPEDRQEELQGEWIHEASAIADGYDRLSLVLETHSPRAAANRARLRRLAVQAYCEAGAASGGRREVDAQVALVLRLPRVGLSDQERACLNRQLVDDFGVIRNPIELARVYGAILESATDESFALLMARGHDASWTGVQRDAWEGLIRELSQGPGTGR